LDCENDPSERFPYGGFSSGGKVRRFALSQHLIEIKEDILDKLDGSAMLLTATVPAR
jgi:hypothetical protein